MRCYELLKKLIATNVLLDLGVKDYYSVYYRQNEINYFEYKAMARRWCY